MLSVNTINNRSRSVCLLTFNGQVSHAKHGNDRNLRVTKNSNRKSNDAVFALFRLLLTSEGEGVKETKESAGGTRQLVRSRKHVCLVKGRQVQSSSLWNT